MVYMSCIHVVYRSCKALDNLPNKMRKGYHQSDQHWKCFTGYIGEKHLRQGIAHMGFHEQIDTTLN